jgi:hypothetical protein
MNRPHYRKETLISELFKEDRKRLIPMPLTSYDIFSIYTVRTDKYGKIIIDNKYTYSVSPKYANSTVTVKFTSDKVEILDEQYRQVVIHNRLYGDGKQESMEWSPYLATLAKKPSALKYTGIYDIFPDPLKRYIETLEKTQLQQLLSGMSKLCETDCFDNVLKTVESSATYNAKDKDSLIALHKSLNSASLPAPIKTPLNAPELKIVPPPSLEYYDDKFLGGR